MIVIARTDTYTIYRKRNQRYAVRKNSTKEWLHGEEKVAVLLAHNLVLAPTFRAPAHPEVPDVEASAAPAGGTGSSGDPSGDPSGEPSGEPSDGSS
jgi:hypothetical protein